MPETQPAPQPTAARRVSISEALRRWIDANEQGLNGFHGQGRVQITASFDMAKNNGQGEVRVMLGT